MANELRVRANFTGGLVDDAPLTSGATSLSSNALQALQVIGATQHMVIVIDPDGFGGNPEIAYLTGHTAASSTATILRGQEGTTARAHLQDTPWVHSATAKDFDAAGGGVGLIGYSSYNPVSTATVTTSTSYADVDATNLKVDFVVPPSGKVVVVLSGVSGTGSATEMGWGLRESTTDIVSGTVCYQGAAASVNIAVAKRLPVSGLTAGASKTYKWSHARISGASTAQTIYGGKEGPAIIEVWAVNF